jgi:hypothetical protein
LTLASTRLLGDFMIAIIPPLKKIPNDATAEQRKKIFEKYCFELRSLNPHLLNFDESRKSFWQWLYNLFT